MSETPDNSGSTPPPGTGTAQDPIKNMQSEFARKTDKLAQENAKLAQQIQQLTNALQTRSPQNNPPQEIDLEDLAYRDPKAYAREVTARAESRAAQMVDQRLDAQQRTQNVMGQLVGEYPELADAGTELSKKSVEIYRNLSDAERSSPMAYKVAVRDAAAELGIQTKSMRKASNDDFSIQGGEGSSRSPASRREQESSVDNKTIAFAELLGINTKDKKVLERLKERSKRKNWGKYE